MGDGPYPLPINCRSRLLRQVRDAGRRRSRTSVFRRYSGCLSRVPFAAHRKPTPRAWQPRSVEPPGRSETERAPHQRKGHGPHQAVFPLSRARFEAIAGPAPVRAFRKRSPIRPTHCGPQEPLCPTTPPELPGSTDRIPDRAAVLRAPGLPRQSPRTKADRCNEARSGNRAANAGRKPYKHRDRPCAA